MSILGAGAEIDFQTVLDDWGDTVTFASPDGLTTVATPALIVRTTALTDLATGQQVAARRSGVTVRLSALGGVMPADGWTVQGSDQGGDFTAYVQGDPMPDYALGICSMRLRT